MTGKRKLPQNWQSFLKYDTNKTELFHFLADKMAEMKVPNTVIVTNGESIFSNHLICLDELAPYNHEEADTRIFVYARQATAEGRRALLMKANDTDVLIIAVIILPELQELVLVKLWVAFGQEQRLKWILVHDLYTYNGSRKDYGAALLPCFQQLRCGVGLPWDGKGKSMHGRHGMCFQRHLLYSRNSANTHHRLKMGTWRC